MYDWMILSIGVLRFSKPSRSALADLTAHNIQGKEQHTQRIRTIAERLWVGFSDHHLSIDGVAVGLLLHPVSTKYGWIYLICCDSKMAGAHKRITEEIHYPVLGRRLHPLFGVYYPTRTEHLGVTTWLSQYKGDKNHCIDVGTKWYPHFCWPNGFQSIDAIDQRNPNALYSVREELKRHPVDAEINLHHADLLESISSSSLIVFNPPWIPGEASSNYAEALFFDGGLFEKFFDQAHPCQHRWAHCLIFQQF